MNIKLATTGLVLTIAGALALTGCSVAQTGSEDSKPVASQSSAFSGDAAGAGDSSAASGTEKFGQTAKFADGVTLTVGKPIAYKPSDTAAGADQKDDITFEVTIKNGSDKPLKPLAYGQMTSASTQGSQITDIERNVGMIPTATVLPGKSITWKEAWSVADKNDLQYEIAPNPEYDSTIFTN